MQQIEDLAVSVPEAPTVLARYPAGAAPSSPGEQVTVAGVDYRITRMREFEGALITYYERLD